MKKNINYWQVIFSPCRQANEQTSFIKSKYQSDFRTLYLVLCNHCV